MIRLVYINPDCFLDTDLSILGFLSKRFELHWFPVFYTDRPIYFSPEEMADFAERNKIIFHPYPRKYRQRDLRNFGFYKAIARDINALHPDIVYSGITEEPFWASASAGIKAPVKVLGLHDVIKHSYGNKLKRTLQSFVHGFVIRRSENICVFSENQKILLKHKFGKDSTCVGMSCKDFGPSDKRPGPVSDGINILFFGSIFRYKGLDLLISAIEELHAEGIGNLKLTVAGKGEDWASCEKLIKTPSLYNLAIRFIDNNEIPDLMGSHHFLALPYRDATQSGPLMIAANYGIPVLAPSYGCFAEVFDETSAVLFSELKEGLKELSGMGQAKYDALRSAAGSLKEKYSPEEIASRYIDYFVRLCSKG